MDEPLKRGAPRRFSLEDRRRFAELIRQFGIRGAQRTSENSISISTLIKIARDYGISLNRGKRTKAA